MFRYILTQSEAETFINIFCIPRNIIYHTILSLLLKKNFHYNLNMQNYFMNLLYSRLYNLMTDRIIFVG